MDPDGRSTFLAILFYVLSLLCAGALGSFGEADESGEDQRDTDLLGFTPLTGAAAAGTVLCAAAAVFCAAGLMRLHPGWAAAAAVLGIAVLFVAYSVGAARHPDDAPHGRGARLFACLLGRPFMVLPRFLFRTMGLSARSRVTEEDVLSLVDDVEDEHGIDENQKQMITGVFELDDVAAGDIMTHRTEVTAVQGGMNARAAVDLALRRGFSRVPVYGKDLDDITGILYVKDLLKLAQDPQAGRRPVSSFARAAMFVPESCLARELLREFRAKRMQIAVVVDEYGGTAGIVTMEDILEEIVGNIEDEFDSGKEKISAAEGGCIADGAASLSDLFEWFGLREPEEAEDGDFDSVSGLVTARLGRIPHRGEKIVLEYGGISFRVLQVSERKVEKVFCRAVPAAGGNAEGHRNGGGDR